jgi:hypothetical protein
VRGAQSSLRAARSIAIVAAVLLAAFGFELAASTGSASGATSCTQTAATWSDLQSYFAAPTGNCIALGAAITNAANQNLVVASGQAVTLDLAGNSLTISGLTSQVAAINVVSAAGTSFTIEDSGSAGQLTVAGGPTAAGIGGNVNQAAGSVTITGGTVTAAGGGGSGSTTSGGAGIGGGGGTGTGPGAGGVGLTVSGGTVTAVGGAGSANAGDARGGSGAGVGGGGGSATGFLAGAGGNGFPVVVSGGVLVGQSQPPTGATATGGGGAGVGGGGAATRVTTGFPSRVGGSGSSVTVSGGTLTASSASDGNSGLAEDVGSGGGTGTTGITASQFGGPLSVAFGGTLVLHRYEFVPAGVSVTNAGTIDLTSSTFPLGLSGPGEVTNDGAVVIESGAALLDTNHPPGQLSVSHHNFVVSYDVNGGSGTGPATDDVYAGTYQAAAISLPSGPTPPGTTTFVGWFTQPTGGAQVTTTTDLAAALAPSGDDTNCAPSCAATLYAQYSPPAVTAVTPAAGPLSGSTGVEVDGSGFTGATQVDFGAVAGTNLTVNSDTQLTVDAPAHAAGTVHVTVTGPTGTSVSGTADQFSYDPAPTVTAVAPSSGSTSGAAVEVDGTGLTGATEVRFGTALGANVVVVSDSKLTVDAPANPPGTVDVVVVTPGGTSTAGPADQFTYVEPGGGGGGGGGGGPITPTPSESPTTSPTPSSSPTASPTSSPTTSPSTSPTTSPTTSPSTSPKPSKSPTTSPKPSMSPTTSPKPSKSPPTSPKPSPSKPPPTSPKPSPSKPPPTAPKPSSSAPSGQSSPASGHSSPSPSGPGSDSPPSSPGAGGAAAGGTGAGGPSGSGTSPGPSPGGAQPPRPGQALNLALASVTGNPYAGAHISAVGTGLKPGSLVTLTVHSASRVIGQFTVANDGTLNSSAEMPSGLSSGRHSLVVDGTAASGSPVERVVAFTVAGKNFGLPVYLVADHPKQTERTVIGVMAVALVAGGLGARATALGRASLAGGRSGGGVRPGASRAPTQSASVKRSGDESEVDVNATDKLEEGLERGDRSRTHRAPGSTLVDRLSTRIPNSIARFSPLLARVVNDGNYLRAMFGSLALLVPLAGLILGGFAAANAHYEALPPATGLAIAIIVLGIVDVFAGFLAAATYSVLVLAAGGGHGAADLRSLIDTDIVFFSVVMVVSATRSLRREPALNLAEWYDRAADIVVGGLLGMWALTKAIDALPGLAGVEVPLADKVRLVAFVALGSVVARYGAETLVMHWYPLRLTRVVPAEDTPLSKTIQWLGAIAKTSIVAFFAESYLGNVWELYLGAAALLATMVLAIYEDEMPDWPFLRKAVPGGIIGLVFGIAVGSWIFHGVGHVVSNSTRVVALAFVFLAVCFLIVQLITSSARKGDAWVQTWWTRILGIPALVFAVLYAQGVVSLG